MTGCGGEHPESGPLHQHPGEGQADERAHSHGVGANADSRYITVALGLIAGFLVFEVVMAFAGHSLALLADAGHMLTDAGALAASLLAIQLARRPARGMWTFGFKRAEVYRHRRTASRCWSSARWSRSRRSPDSCIPCPSPAASWSRSPRWAWL